jgi:hypothetical protein
MSDYINAEEVFYPELIERCQKRLGDERHKITFARDLFAALTKTEQPLGPTIVNECRMLMLRQDVRVVYFAGTKMRRRLTSKETAERLLRQGCTVQATADAIGVTRQTISNWGFRSSRKGGAKGGYHSHVKSVGHSESTLRMGVECLYRLATKDISLRVRLDGCKTDRERLVLLARAWKCSYKALRRRALLAGAAARTAMTEQGED